MHVAGARLGVGRAADAAEPVPRAPQHQRARVRQQRGRVGRQHGRQRPQFPQLGGLRQAAAAAGDPGAEFDEHGALAAEPA